MTVTTPATTAAEWADAFARASNEDAEIQAHGKYFTCSYLLDMAERTFVVEVSRGKKRHMRNAAVGLIVGAGVGAVGGYITGEDDCSQEWLCINRPTGAFLGGAFFGSLGGVVGLITGVIPTETWERVSLEGRRISLVAPSTGHGRGVGLRLAF